MATYYLDYEHGNDIALVTTGTISTAQSMFGGASLAVGTASGGGTGAQIPSFPDLDFGAAQFTIEGWVYFTGSGVTTATLVSRWGSSATLQAYALFLSSGSLIMRLYDGSTAHDTSIAWAPAATTWYHLAADRDSSGNVRLYINGVMQAKTVSPQSVQIVTQPLTFGYVTGYESSFTSPGYIDDVRITKGVARYASDAGFSLPTSAYPEGSSDPYWSKVVMLAHFDAIYDGKSYATRRKTISNLTGVAAGDTVRLAAAPDPTLVGNATWTQYSKIITLTSPVTALLSSCETAWTASTNVTTNVSSSLAKEGTNCTSIAISSSFTTGKAAYLAISSLDLSGYQQISFWLQPSAAISAGVMSLRLCSDTVGATPVHTIPFPAIPNAGWVPMTLDFGAALSSGIQSIALYRDVAGGAVTVYLDNILACKASTDPTALTLTSLIGKACNTSWAASTVYAGGDQRKPTQPNRNGFRYQATAGTSGTAEPAWPLDVGLTVLDGSVTWTCAGLEDTWYAIQSINGTTVKLDIDANGQATNGRGYPGATEAVPTYRREAIKTGMVTNGNFINQPQSSGNDGIPITFSGGWDRTSMSSQSGETWFDGQNGQGYFFHYNSKNYLTVANISGVRYTFGMYEFGLGWNVNYCHFNNMSSLGVSVLNSAPTAKVTGMVANCNANTGLNLNNPACISFLRCSFDSNLGQGISTGNYRYSGSHNYVFCRNNANYGLFYGGYTAITVSNLVTANNVSGGVSCSGSPTMYLNNSLLSDSTPLTVPGTFDTAIYCTKYQKTANNHYIYIDGGSIISATDQRHTASGISWKFRPTSTSRNSAYPLKLSVAKVAVTANTMVNVSIWCYRDNVNIKGQLVLPGGQIAGVGAELAIDCQPSINTWTQSSNLVFTPTEDGVVELFFRVWDGVGTANNFWIDDISVG